ncbi:hypothetical protein [Pseudomonas aeruginosa]|uniref:hypothetical protein n=1 Tax=Pseudomonas aeruginosa TaxID=287 RepID=UPI000F53D71E|nr:hypothetical protein [Pseudomonas aeruginosa]EJB8386524.1 hypothetical protein [Pseudomonas aeruginosa]MBN0026309.1 hypothetical protein [Pseudomonas aeruginosa]MBN0055613.1 hypothetical protein [Pseudomonas aeruginosa]MBN0065442.1 hypothetical protein [Pseudomonas aeruginosa]MBN0105319.1 hypothetical protein [Pseudomonas aeruginosa]
MIFSTEIEVVNLLSRFLNSCGFETKEEVSSMGQSIDLVGRKNRWLYAFEAKRDNWKKGLDQCKSHELVADYICLAMGSPSISLDLMKEIERLGYGLVWCKPDTKTCEWVYQPRVNKKIWKPQKQILIKNLKEH